MNVSKGKKLRVLLIPDYVQWIIGTIAREIEKWNPELSFTIVSEAYINRYIDDHEKFLNSFDIVHILNEFIYEIPDYLPSCKNTRGKYT